MHTDSHTLDLLTSTEKHRNLIENPFHDGQEVWIPEGTAFTSTHPSKVGPQVTKRGYYVTVRMARAGHVDLWNDAGRGRGYVMLPQVTWAGSGGYWMDVKVTPEFCEANNVEMPPLPNLDPFQRDRLDVEPAYGQGYDNRIQPPA